MKKYILIAIGCLIVIAIGFVLLASTGSKNTAGGANPDQTADANQAAAESARKPADIKVAIYDPATTPSALTDLLEKRLKALGYQVDTTTTVPDPTQVPSNLTTLFLRGTMAPSFVTLQHTFLNSSLVRQFTSDAFSEDVLIAAWNVDDITWGDLAADAQTLAMPDPASVSIVVYNAGAASGAAGTVAGILKGQGYTQAAAKNGATAITGPSVIYYQTGYKDVAKKLMGVLKTNGYPDRTYRYQQNQEADLVLMLAAPQTATSTATSTKP